MENITGSMATSVVIALLIILTIVIVFVYLYLNFETFKDGKQCKCGKASVIGAQGQELSVLPPVPGQPSPSPVKFVHSFCICLWRQKYFWFIALCISLVTRLHPPFFCQVCALFLYFYKLPWSTCINISDSLHEKWPSKGRRVFCSEWAIEPAALSEIDVITGGDSTQSIGRPHTAALSRHMFKMFKQILLLTSNRQRWQ